MKRILPSQKNWYGLALSFTVMTAMDLPAQTRTSIDTQASNHECMLATHETMPVLATDRLPLHRTGNSDSIPTIIRYANTILDKRAILHGLVDRKWGMKLTVAGIYVKDQMLFYQLFIDNHSPLDYDIDRLRFFIKDRNMGKRTAVQELELPARYVAGYCQTVKARNRSTLVFVLERHSIPDAKLLALDITEKNGGRDLHAKLTNYQLMKAIMLPDGL